MNKKKQELNYRKSIVEAENSRYGYPLGHGYRCPAIGLEMSRRYVVEADHVCEKWTKGMARAIGYVTRW